MLHRSIIFLSFAAFLVVPSIVKAAEDADERETTPRVQMVSFARAPYETMAGRLLKSGNFEEALVAFRKALRSNETDPVLQREYEDLRRILQYRQLIDDARSATQRNMMVEQLRRYYLRHELHRENIDLAVGDYCVNRSTKNACRLIEAFVHAREYEQAVDFIDSLGDAANDRFRIEKARILLMDERHGEALRVLQAVSASPPDSPDLLLELSRLQAQTRQNASAIKTLTRCFELMPLQRLQAVRREIADYPEFQAIRTSPEFLAVLQIRSEEPLCGKPCSRKWIGVSFDREPEYLKKCKLGEIIDLDFWRVH